MRRRNSINSTLPDELIMEIFRNLHWKSSRDACALVCRRWQTLERLTRLNLRFGGNEPYGSSDSHVNRVANRFVNVTDLHIDERLSGDGRRGSVRQSMWQYKVMLDNFNPRCPTDAGLAAVADGFTKLEN